MIAEVTVGFKGGAVIHVHENSDHMYASIDLVAHKLQKAVNRRHEKLLDMPIRAERRSKKKANEQLDLLEQEFDSDDLDVSHSAFENEMKLSFITTYTD